MKRSLALLEATIGVRPPSNTLAATDTKSNAIYDQMPNNPWCVQVSSGMRDRVTARLTLED